MAKKLTKPIKPIEATAEELTASIFSNKREIKAPLVTLPSSIPINKKIEMDGIELLKLIPNKSITASFFDPQYRGVLDHLKFGNESTSRSNNRVALAQMTEQQIKSFFEELNRVLIPSGHVFLWVDKFHLCNDFRKWIEGTTFDVVDMMTWHKMKIGVGYRTRHASEFIIILQKQPRKAKGVWTLRNIPDVWAEKVKSTKQHPHCKPIELQGELIEAISNEGDLILDPCAGSFSVLEACKNKKRNFIGCDLKINN